MSVTYGNGQSVADPTDPESTAILHALIGVPEARGMGVVIIRGGVVRVARQPSPPRIQWLVLEIRPAAAAPPLPDPHPEDHAAGEWTDLGLNCAGLLLSGAGTVGTIALAPESGGLSFGATMYMASQAAVAAGQCSVSVYRVWNLYHGNETANQAMDRSLAYHLVMYSADAYALLDVARTGMESVRYAQDIAESEVSFSRLLSEQLNRHERLRLTEALELKGVRRVAAARLALGARTRITQAIAAALALSGSVRSGVLQAAGQRLYIWAIDGDATRQQPAGAAPAGASSFSAPSPSPTLP